MMLASRGGLVLLTFFALLVVLLPARVLASSLAGLVAKVDPAVVVIHTQSVTDVKSADGVHVATQRGLGSGVVISDEGQIMTARPRRAGDRQDRG